MFLYVELLFLRKLSNFARSGPVELLLAVIYFRFGRTRVRAHPSTLCTAYDPCVPYLGKIQAARGSLYSTRILCPILLPFPEHVFFHHTALSLTPTTTTKYR